MSETMAALSDGFTLDSLGGNCPVQAEGNIDGRPWYFRARGDEWEMYVGPVGASNLWTGADWLFGPDTWRIERDYGDGPFDAGYMPDDEARGFIVGALMTFRTLAARSTK